MEILQNAIKAMIAKDAIYYALLAIGLNVQFGYAGLLNFGQVAFALVGAFGVAATVVKLPALLEGAGVDMSTWLNGWVVDNLFWFGLIVGVLCAVVLALLLGAPTLRLRADYLAITTIAAAEILRVVFRTPNLSDVTGGTRGIFGYSDAFYDLSPLPLSEQYRPLGIAFTGQEIWALTIGWLLIALSTFFVWLLMRSPWGRVQKAIREDEDAARALGKNVFSYKMQALIIGGIIGAIAGIFEGTASRSVIPDTYQNAVTFFAYAVLILGGTARVMGPVVGAVILWFLFSVTEGVLSRLGGEGGIISPEILDAQGLAAIRFVLVGVGLMLLMAFRPQGIFGDRREVALDAR